MNTPGRYSVDETKQIEGELLQAVADAKEAYRSDSKTHDDLIALAQDIGLEQSDGGLAMRRAVFLQRAATRRYADAIKAMNDFVLREKTPEFPKALDSARLRYLNAEKKFKKTLDRMSGMPLGESGLLEAVFARNVAYNSYIAALKRFTGQHEEPRGSDQKPGIDAGQPTRKGPQSALRIRQTKIQSGF